MCVPHDLVEVDVFAGSGVPEDHILRHPFGRIPAFRHDGFGCMKAVPSRVMWTRLSPDVRCSRETCMRGRV